MAKFADLTKEQQLEYTNILLNNYIERRRLIQRYRGATTEAERIAVQSTLDKKVAEDLTVDAFFELGGK